MRLSVEGKNIGKLKQSQASPLANKKSQKEARTFVLSQDYP